MIRRNHMQNRPHQWPTTSVDRTYDDVNGDYLGKVNVSLLTWSNLSLSVWEYLRSNAIFISFGGKKKGGESHDRILKRSIRHL